jgi:hypothetical protein
MYLNPIKMAEIDLLMQKIAKIARMQYLENH